MPDLTNYPGPIAPTTSVYNTAEVNKSASPLPRRLTGLLTAVITGATICCVCGALLLLLFSHTVSSVLPKDAVLLVLLVLGFISMSVLTAFTRFVQSISDDYNTPAPAEKPALVSGSAYKGL